MAWSMPFVAPPAAIGEKLAGPTRRGMEGHQTQNSRHITRQTMALRGYLRGLGAGVGEYLRNESWNPRGAFSCREKVTPGARVMVDLRDAVVFM